MLWPNSEIALLWGKRCRCKNDQVQQFDQLSDFFMHWKLLCSLKEIRASAKIIFHEKNVTVYQWSNIILFAELKNDLKSTFLVLSRAIFD